MSKTLQNYVRVPYALIRTLTAQELQIWCSIRQHSPRFVVTLYTLSAQLKKSTKAVSRIVHALIDKGYVNKTLAPGHKQLHRYTAVIPDNNNK